MKRKKNGTEPLHLLNSPQSDKTGLLKAGTLSLFLHIAFVIIVFSLGLRSTMTKMPPSVYRVTIRPLLGDGLPKGASGSPGSEGLPASPPVEKPKPVEKPITKEPKKGEVPHETKKQKPQELVKKDEKVEGLKKSTKKEEKIEKEVRSRETLQEALEEIRKKAALDKIQRRVARREEPEKGQIEGPSTTPSSQTSIGSSSKNLSGPGSGVGTGTGSGTGIGTGSGDGTGSGGSPTGSPWGSPFGGSTALQSKLDEYYSTIWEEIKKEWAIPGDISKGRVDLETTIVIIVEKDGRIQKSWFEKRSGNALYDQSAMRAIKKAEPLPPIPKELNDNTLEIGINFLPE